MAKHHITTAATLGMRAGRDEYVAKCATSGLPQVRAAASKYSGRKGFARYCDDFGPAVTKAQGGTTTRTHTRSTPREVVEVSPIEAQLASLRAQLALLEAEAAAPVATPPASKPATTKENLWRPWAIRKYGIPQKVGGTFVYTSKKSKKASTHKVVRVTEDGVFTVKVA